VLGSGEIGRQTAPNLHYTESSEGNAIFMGRVVEALHKAVEGSDLSESEAAGALEEILSGESEPALVAGLLTALRAKGETVDEIVGFARAMRAAAAPIPCSTAAESMVDTCGTGGDGADTFNISTAAVFVVAGVGVPVAKHGNRSISSRCGSADVLEALGAVVQLTPEQAGRAIDETGVGFLFAPLIHPAMKHVQPVRRALKMRTVFNLLGPLTNPAGAGAQLVGVFADDRVEDVARALARLGVSRAMVVHGADGLDEITVRAETQVAEVEGGEVRTRKLRPEDFGVEQAPADSLAGGDAEQNAAILRRILDGARGPERDVVLANAAAALMLAGKATSLSEGAAAAAKAIDSGSARAKLETFVAFTDQFRSE